MYENYEVLFVDDEEDIIRSLRRGLIDEEYSCHFATDGYKALEIMENNPVAVIVSDMRMPGMDGLKLLKEVRERWPKTIRIVLSGYMQLPQILLSVNQAGIFRFIAKPWRLEDEFIIIIREALDQYIQNEKEENYIKKLEKQKKLYLDLLRKYSKQTRQSKKAIEVFSAMGIANVAFYAQGFDTEIHKNIQNAGKVLFSLFSDANIAKSEEIMSGDLTERLSEFVEARFKPATISKLTDREMNVSVSCKMIEAIIDASTMIFYDEFAASGVASRIGVENNDYYCIYLVTSFKDTALDTQSQIDQKIAYFSKVLGELSGLDLTCFAEKYSAKIVIAIILNKPPA